MNTKHIVHIIPTLGYGGAERFVVDLAGNADRQLFQHSIIVLFDHTPLAVDLPDDVCVRVVQKKGRLSFGLFRSLKKALKEMKPDVIHTHLSGGDIWGRMVGYRLGIPVVTTEHNMNVDEGFLKRTIKRCLKNKTALYTVPSQAVATWMQQMYGISSDTVRVIIHGVRLSRFVDIPFSTYAEPMKLLLIGRLTKQKGHEIALRALAMQRHADWLLSIVGDGPEKERIETLISTLGLSERVEVLPATEDVAFHYAEADVVLVPSHWEGLGIVVIEAMASGRLVIASETGGIPELIIHQQNGLLFANGDVDMLSNILSRLFSDDIDVETLTHQARAFAISHCAIDRMVREYEAVYNSV